MNFCSECKCSKTIEFTNGFKIFCTFRKVNKNPLKNDCTPFFIGFRKYNATSCSHFEKDVKESLAP